MSRASLCKVKHRAANVYPMPTVSGRGWQFVRTYKFKIDGEFVTVKKMPKSARRHIQYLLFVVNDKEGATEAAREWAANRLMSLDNACAHLFEQERLHAIRETRCRAMHASAETQPVHLHKSHADSVTSVYVMSAEERAMYRTAHRAAADVDINGVVKATEGAERLKTLDAIAATKKEIKRCTEKLAASTKVRYINYWQNKLTDAVNQLAELTKPTK